jgi:TonB family protein
MAIANFALLSVALATALAPAAASDPARQAEANAALNVYPKESLANGEQGTVFYHVRIDARGHPTDCEVTQSSGYDRLDMATCSMLMDRAQFTPGRDGRGHATRSTFDGKVVWRIV